MTGEGAALRLTPREREVLAAIGRRWSNVEIAREFFVSVCTVESHVAALRRKLGAASRTDLIRLASRQLARPVPVPANSFVGREDELRDVRRLLDRTPWVTITGPPGSGKTRLALELAQREARAGDREPVVVELDRSAPGAAVTPLASVLGIAAPGAAAGTGDPTDDLAAACALALGTGHFLVVLDSCERAASEVERLARTLIRSGAVTVVATSQVPIGAGDETVYPLDPLPITADGAIRLFLDRAAAAAPARPVSTADLASVERICRRLDGLPLAIELAAARTRHLTLPELADRLDESLAVLDRAGPAHRHRRLESAFDWTWDLLDDEERELLQLLAAMPGSFDMTLVESLAPDLPGGASRVALRLLDRSLIGPAGAPSEPARFRLLDSLRRFVGGRTPPEVAAGARRRHAELHAQATEAIASRIGTDDDLSLIARAQRLIPEAAAALLWAVPLDADLALRLARSLAILAEHAGPDLEALTAITRAPPRPRCATGRPPRTCSPSVLLSLTTTCGAPRRSPATPSPSPTMRRAGSPPITWPGGSPPSSGPGRTPNATSRPRSTSPSGSAGPASWRRSGRPGAWPGGPRIRTIPIGRWPTWSRPPTPSPKPAMPCTSTTACT